MRLPAEHKEVRHHGDKMINNLEDALVTAMYLNAFIRHAHSVRMANFTPMPTFIGMINSHVLMTRCCCRQFFIRSKFIAAPADNWPWMYSGPAIPSPVPTRIAHIPVSEHLMSPPHWMSPVSNWSYM